LIKEFNYKQTTY